MSRFDVRILAVMLTLVELNATAQSPAPASEPEASAPAATVGASSDTGVVTLGPDVEAQAEEMAELSREIDTAALKLKNARLQVDLKKAEEELSGSSGPTGAPLLIGIYMGERSFAEFAVGQAIRRASVGGYVAEDMRVVEIRQGWVQVEANGRRKRLFLNKREASPMVPATDYAPAYPGRAVTVEQAAHVGAGQQ